MITPVLVGAVRTPLGRLDGALSDHDAQSLAAHVIREALIRSGIEGTQVDEVIVAHAAGPQGNLARRAVLDAGLGAEVPAMTVDRQCSGGLDAVVLACRLVQSGAARIVVAAGTESATHSPIRTSVGQDARTNGRSFFPRMPFSGGGYEDPGMVESAEAIADDLGISRADQDAFAAESHIRAITAVDNAVFGTEIVPVTGFSVDECPRRRLTAERCARFPAIVRRDGTVTAANSSQIADGAAAVVVTHPEVVGDRASVAFVDAASAGVEPSHCGLGAIAATKVLVGRNPELDPASVGTVAITEAFASQTLATIAALGLDPGTVNPRGGAIALGHPWGASGTIQVVRAIHEISRGAEDALAMAAVAGGMGTAAWFRAVP